MTLTTPAQTGSKDFRPALNALRAAASLWVVVYHFRYYSDFAWFDLFAVPQGYLGVDVFFVLSGLVISHVYLSGALASYGLFLHMRFLWLRVARLWPVHAVIMIALLVAAMMSGRVLSADDMADWFSLTFLFRQWLLPEAYAWNSPAWSISAEFFAYAIVFPAVIACARVLGMRMAGVGLASLGLPIYHAIEAQFGTINLIGYAGPILRVIAGFCLGAGLYCLIHDRVCGARWDALVWVGGGAFVASLMAGSDTLTIAAFSLLLVGLYLSNGAVARGLSVKPLYLLGEWSFALYLIHIPMLRLASYVAQDAGLERGVVFCLGVLALSIAASAVTYRCIETPARGWLKGAVPSWGFAGRAKAA